MSVDVLFAGVPARVFSTSVDWYSRLFGRPPDVVAHDREVMWRVVGSGWLFVVEDAERAGRSLVAVAVSELESVLAELASRGLDCPAIEPIGDAARKAILTDPDGNSVELLHVTSAGSG